MRLIEERNQRGWSRAELARRAGMHPSTVSLIESGRLVPYPSQVEKLADALGIPRADRPGLLVTDPQADSPGSGHPVQDTERTQSGRDARR